jgi:hypothetical protein
MLFLSRVWPRAADLAGGPALDPNVTLTKEQQKIVDDNLGTIRSSIGDRMAAYRATGVLRMARTLDEVITELSLLGGLELSDPRDGHVRWVLYRRMIDSGQNANLLFEAVGVEPDPSIALSVVLHLLEDLPATARSSWVSQLRVERDRVFAARRAIELDILDLSNAGGLSIQRSAEAPQEWSDWLQLNLANSCGDRDVLERLAERGQTKRIRRSAEQRMRFLNFL